MMFPLYSLLKDSQFRVPHVNIVLLHLKRWHLMEWVRAVMATTFAVQTGEPLPPVLLQHETDITFEQPTMALEGVPADTWVRAPQLCYGIAAHTCPTHVSLSIVPRLPLHSLFGRQRCPAATLARPRVLSAAQRGRCRWRSSAS